MLDKYSEAYYNGQPLISDEEFDAIDSTETVGYDIGDGHVHRYPMWSLQKAYGVENPLAWYNKEIIETPKLDGAAISIEYTDGQLTCAATRGNGKQGLIITDKIKLLVPNIVVGNIQITGEVVAPKHIKNSRNYAAGALGLNSVEEFSTRELTFIAYGLSPSTDSYFNSMSVLRQLGFNTVLDSAWDEFPQDGRVFRINNQADYDGAGYTAKFPRGAYALKQQAQAVHTKLLSVEWNVGRSGVVAPVAILEPVKVGDATVSRATLHNMAYINQLGLEIGCTVAVIRSGDIIPRIVGRV